jgi:hypothetical protein
VNRFNAPPPFRGTRCRRAASERPALIAALVSMLAPPWAATQDTTPRIGLALSGGGARGLRIEPLNTPARLAPHRGQPVASRYGPDLRRTCGTSVRLDLGQSRTARSCAARSGYLPGTHLPPPIQGITLMRGVSHARDAQRRPGP